MGIPPGLAVVIGDNAILFAFHRPIFWNLPCGAGNAAMDFTSQKLSSPTRDWIERQFVLFGSIIPASSEDVTHRRTSYFYRRCAIAWAGMSRQWWPSKTFPSLCVRFAKMYLAKYREAKQAGGLTTPS